MRALRLFIFIQIQKFTKPESFFILTSSFNDWLGKVLQFPCLRSVFNYVFLLYIIDFIIYIYF